MSMEYVAEMKTAKMKTVYITEGGATATDGQNGGSMTRSVLGSMKGGVGHGFARGPPYTTATLESMQLSAVVAWLPDNQLPPALW